MKKVALPSLGTDAAVGGAASTKISSSTMKLENTAIAEIITSIYISHNSLIYYCYNKFRHILFTHSLFTYSFRVEIDVLSDKKSTKVYSNAYLAKCTPYHGKGAHYLCKSTHYLGKDTHILGKGTPFSLTLLPG